MFIPCNYFRHRRLLPFQCLPIRRVAQVRRMVQHDAVLLGQLDNGVADAFVELRAKGHEASRPPQAVFAHHFEIIVEVHGRPCRHGAILPPVVLAAHEEARLAADRQPRPFLLDADAFRLHGLVPNHYGRRLRIDDFPANHKLCLNVYIIRRFLQDVPCCFNLRLAAALHGESRLLHGDFRTVFSCQNKPHTTVAVLLAEIRNNRLQRRVLPPAVAHIASRRPAYINTAEQCFYNRLQESRAFAVVCKQIHVIDSEERPAGAREDIRVMVHHRSGVATAAAILVKAFQQRDPPCAIRTEAMTVHAKLPNGGESSCTFPTSFQWTSCIEDACRLADSDSLYVTQFKRWIEDVDLRW